MGIEISVKYPQSGNEYTLKHESKGLLIVYRNGVLMGYIGLATLAGDLEARRR